MAETLVELVARISADAAELKKGLADAEKAVEGTGKNLDKEAKKTTKSFKAEFAALGKQFVILGGAITGAMGLAVKGFTSMGDELVHMSEKTGISVQSLSELKYAAEVADVSLSDLQIAFRGMSNIMETARGGGEEAVKTFTKLGLNFKNLEDLGPEELFMKLASAIGSIPDPVQRAATAVDVFGRSGMALIPMFADGANGIAKLRQRAIDLGITMSDEVAESGHELSIAFTDIKAAVLGLTNSVGAVLTPTLKNLANNIVSVVRNVTDWARENPELFKTVTLITGAIGGLLLAVGTTILALPKLIDGIKALGVAFTWLSANPVVLVITLITAAIAGLAIAWATNWMDIRGKMEVAVSWIINNLGKLAEYIDIFHFGTAKAMKEFSADFGSAAMKYKAEAQRIADATDKVRTILNKMLDEKSTKEASTYNRTMSVISKTMDAYQAQYDARIELINKAYDAELKAIDKSLDAQVEGYQDEIDSIQQQLDKTARLEEERLNKEKIAGMKSAIEHADNADERATLQAELDAYLIELEKDRLRTEKEDEITNLRILIDEARKAAEEKRELAQETADKDKETEKAVLDTILAGLAERQKAETTNHETRMAEITEEQTAVEMAEGAELIAIQTKLAGELEATKAQRDALNALAPVVLTTIHQEVYTSGSSGEAQPTGTNTGATSPLSPGGGSTYLEPVFEAPGGRQSQYPFLAEGGIISQPTLAMVGESGPEAVVPLNEMGGNITINFTQPTFFDREETMNKFVDMIRKGIQRQDRLRFGGAYNG